MCKTIALPIKPIYPWPGEYPIRTDVVILLDKFQAYCFKPSQPILRVYQEYLDLN